MSDKEITFEGKMSDELKSIKKLECHQSLLFNKELIEPMKEKLK